MTEPLKLRRLQHLVLLAQNLNFARAAELACLSQSAFSRSIQALEESLGLRLFDRGLRRVKLTPAGQRLVTRAQRLLASTSDMQRELELLRRGDLGDIAAGAGPFTAATVFPDALARLRAEHPSVNVRLIVDNWWSLVQALDAEKLDFFISDIREIAPTSDIDILPMGTLMGSLFCRPGHPLLAKGSLDLADLANASFASVHMPDTVRSVLNQLLAPYGVPEFPVVFECDSAITTREFIFRTDVVLIACREAVQVELDCGRLHELRVRQLQAMGTQSPLRTEIGIVRRLDRTLTRASELLIDYAIEVARRRLAAPAAPSPRAMMARPTFVATCE
jgi:DNA-binding transcriptional LysR family regulator